MLIGNKEETCEAPVAEGSEFCSMGVEERLKP